MDATTIHSTAKKINSCLQLFSDKDWNYSRIALQVIPLQSVASPYVLWVDGIKTGAKEGQNEVKQVQKEVVWGDRHASELGILELVSLRLNKALLAVGMGKFDEHPVIRLVKSDELRAQGVTEALWYVVTEVGGEEFDSR